MSSDGSASRAMRRELRAIERDAAREKEVRQRFEERIAEKKIKFERAKKHADPIVSRRDWFKEQLEEVQKDMETLQQALATNKRVKKELEDEIEKARQQMTDLDQYVSVATRSRRSDEPESRAQADYVQARHNLERRITEFQGTVEGFKQAIRKTLGLIRDKTKMIEKCTQVAELSKIPAEHVLKETRAAFQLWQYALDKARKPWPQDKEEREMIYLEDLKQLLEDELADNVSIWPPGHRDDSRVQTAGGPYIALALKDNPAWGRAYIQCSSEIGFRFQVNHTSLRPGAENIVENLEIEETSYFETEEGIAADMRHWAKTGAKHKAGGSGV
jgi:chromosome segregation ATPase